jgi:hypothetical protein
LSFEFILPNLLVSNFLAVHFLMDFGFLVGPHFLAPGFLGLDFLVLKAQLISSKLRKILGHATQASHATFHMGMLLLLLHAGSFLRMRRVLGTSGVGTSGGEGLRTSGELARSGNGFLLLMERGGGFFLEGAEAALLGGLARLLPRRGRGGGGGGVGVADATALLLLLKFP